MCQARVSVPVFVCIVTYLRLCLKKKVFFSCLLFIILSIFATEIIPLANKQR